MTDAPSLTIHATPAVVPTSTPTMQTPIATTPTLSDRDLAQTREAAQAATERGEQNLRAYEAKYQQPLDLYGMVLEESSQQPIAGAKVMLSPIEHAGIGAKESPPIIVYTDAQGRFSFLGHKGAYVDAKASKAGYYTLGRRSGAFFTHDEVDTHDPYMNRRLITSDPAQPARLYLRQQGTPATKLVSHELSQEIPHDGSPGGVLLASGSAAVPGRGDLLVECKGNDNGIPGGTPFDWWCRVTVPGGGLQPRNDEFAFQAPESGYQPGEEVNMPAALSKGQWQGTMRRDYFLRLANGRYARAQIEVHPGGHHLFYLTYYLNPAPGDRNLEAVADTKPKDYR